MLSFKPAFSLSSFTLLQTVFSSSSLSATDCLLTQCLITEHLVVSWELQKILAGWGELCEKIMNSKKSLFFCSADYQFLVILKKAEHQRIYWNFQDMLIKLWRIIFTLSLTQFKLLLLPVNFENSCACHLESKTHGQFFSPFSIF